MIQPIRDHILIEVPVPEKETKTESGIVLANTAAMPKQITGKVINVGEGRLLENGTQIPLSVSVGDNVIYYEYAGVIVHPEKKDPTKNYLIIKQNDILAVIK